MNTSKKIRHIIFDWDDVFTLGSKEGYFKCYHNMLKELNVHLDPEDEKQRILKRWGQTYQAEIAELLKEKPELIEKGCEIYLKNLFGNTFVDSLTFVPGGIELLNRLNTKYILTLTTGVHPKIFRDKIVPKFKVPEVFSYILTSQDLPDQSNAKPDPYTAQELMKKTRTSPAETIMVGDSKNDILTASNAGISPVAVLSGHLNREEAQTLGVKYIIPDVTHIETILKEINEK